MYDLSQPSSRLRVQARAQLREFLRTIPRELPHERITIRTGAGRSRTFTRAELTEAIDHLPPRQRQIIKLGLELNRSRARVCQLVGGISIKTYERDEVAALETLLGYD